MSRKKQKMKLTQDEFNQLHLEGKLELSASPCSGNLGVGWAGILYDHLLYEDDKYYYQEYYLANGESKYMSSDDDFDDYTKKEEVIILIEDN